MSEAYLALARRLYRPVNNAGPKDVPTVGRYYNVEYLAITRKDLLYQRRPQNRGYSKKALQYIHEHKHIRGNSPASQSAEHRDRTRTFPSNVKVHQAFAKSPFCTFSRINLKLIGAALTSLSALESYNLRRGEVT
jgi:hypothetical protein